LPPVPFGESLSAENRGRMVKFAVSQETVLWQVEHAAPKHRGRRRMLGVRRLLPGCEMASGIPAVRRRDFQIEVAAHVAIQTGNIRVPFVSGKTDRRREWFTLAPSQLSNEWHESQVCGN